MTNEEFVNHCAHQFMGITIDDLTALEMNLVQRLERMKKIKRKESDYNGIKIIELVLA